MTDDQKHAIEHAQKVLRAVKLYDLAASLGNTQGADARPVAISPREVKRDSDFSVTVVFASCRLASEFESQMIANLKE